MVCMRSMFMHSGLNRQMGAGAIMRWTPMNPTPSVS